jgi:flagellar protein FlgJ
MKIGDPRAASALALDQLSTQVPMKASVGDSPEAIMEAARAFESIFINELMKSMRKTLPEDGMLNSGFANNVFNSMLDQEYASIASRSDQFGLAHMIALQLNRGEPLSPNGLSPDDIPAGEAPPGRAALDARRLLSAPHMSAPHMSGARGAWRADPEAAREARELLGEETVRVDGEDVPSWLLEEITEEPSQPSAADEDSFKEDEVLPPPSEHTPAERKPTADLDARRLSPRALSAYQRLKG